MLPESLLALLLFSIPSTTATSQPLAQHAQLDPREAAHAKRALSIQARMQKEKPIGVRKMSEDAGEMFFLDNWIFASDLVPRDTPPASRIQHSGNATMLGFSPLRLHAERDALDSLFRIAPRAQLLKRDFKCPSGTNSCSSIGAPDSCCASGDTCINIEDTGFGSVGCCPEGESCGGAISCDTSAGYTSCPDSDNGGCCLPGYSCQGVGCVAQGTSVTFVQPSTSSRASSTAVVVVPTTPSTTITPTPSSSSSSSKPASSSASSQAPSAPVRPTSGSDATTAAPSSSASVDVCPTGFYVCSAVYPSGCCRVGRDCQTSGSCIPTSSVTVVNSNGVTIAAPTGASLAAGGGSGGSCPSNWYSCAASVGGNCCPNGFACGNECSATAGTSVTDKVAPSTASSFSYTSILITISGAIAVGVGMIIL